MKQEKPNEIPTESGSGGKPNEISMKNRNLENPNGNSVKNGSAKNPNDISVKNGTAKSPNENSADDQNSQSGRKSANQGKMAVSKQPSVYNELADPDQDEFWYEKINSDPWKLSLTEKTFYFHNLDAKWNPTSVNDSRIYTYIKKTHHILVCGDVPYVYRGGYYNDDVKGTILKTMIRGCLLEVFIRSNTIDRIYRLFLQDDELVKDAEDLNDYAGNWVNFQNGMYNAKNGKLYRHDWTIYSTTQIPWTYKPDGSHGPGDEIEKFLNFAVPDPEDREMLLQYMGLCCTIDTRQQKMLIMCGEGGTGKSTLIKLLQDIVGKRNVSNVPMSKLSERFTAVFMMGKLLNSCADLEIDALDDVSIIKQLIGEDEIKAEHKGKSVFSFENFAKMLFSTNELPLVRNEKTDGFYRRLLVLTMNQKPEKRDVNLKDKLRKQLPYLIHLCMQALGRMYRNGAITISQNSIMATRQLRKDSDTIEAFLADNCTDGDLDRDKIERKELYDKYTEYCKEWECEAHRKKNFFKALRNKGYSEGPVNGTYCFKGIRWKDTDSDGFMVVDDSVDLDGVPF